MSDAPVTLFIPFGEGYGNPGLTIRADSLDELDSILASASDPTDAGDPDSVSKLDSVLSGVETIKAAVLLKFPQAPKATAARSSNHPQAQSNSEAAPSCSHGEMKWRSGEKNGKKWQGWFCNAPYGQDKCKPQFK